MKKIILSIGLALVLLLSLCPVALAGGGEDVDIQVSDIVVVGEPWVGYVVTASGTITIVATSSAFPNTWQWGVAGADSNAYFTVADPEGSIVDGGANAESDYAVGYNPLGPANFPANADASQVYSWSSAIYLNQTGDWVITQGGDASALWATLFGIIPTGFGFDSESLLKSLTIRATTRMNPCFMVNLCDYKAREWWLEDGSCYMLLIPEGTTATNPVAGKICNFSVTLTAGAVIFTPSEMTLSQSVTLLKKVGGVWVEVMTFSQVEGGKAVPLD